MGLLDDDDAPPPYKPPQRGKGRRYENQSILSQIKRDEELNNL